MHRLTRISRIGGTALGWVIGAPCASWPARSAARYDGPFDRHTGTPILLVNMRYEPNTPLVSARIAERRLGNAVLLVQDGYGHLTANNPSACVDAALSAYLVRLRTPARGSRLRLRPRPVRPGVRPALRREPPSSGLGSPCHRGCSSSTTTRRSGTRPGGCCRRPGSTWWPARPTRAAALRLARELRPDVVLVDVQLPDSDGFALARELIAGPGAPAVVLVSGRPRSDYGRLVERSGALGFIDKAEFSGPRLLGRCSAELPGDAPRQDRSTCSTASTRRDRPGRPARPACRRCWRRTSPPPAA